MRHSPLIGTALALALAASLSIPATAAVWREQSDATLDARSATAIEVRNARGQIDVRPSADGAIHVRALKIAHGRTTADARRLADQTIVKFDPGAIVKLEVVYPRIVHQVNLWGSFNDDDLPKSEIRLSIEVPARLAATLTASSGEIHTEGLNSAQMLRSSSGDIEVLQAGGPVNARSASGDIDVDRARGGEANAASGSIRWGEATGPLRAASASGDITIDEARDSLVASAQSGTITVGRALRGVTAETASGDIRVTEASGLVDLEAASGDVKAGLTRGTRRATVRTSSGDATVTLAGSVGWTVRVRTSSGSIDIDESAMVERHSRRDLEARIRGGGAPVEVTTASGSARVEGGKP